MQAHETQENYYMRAKFDFLMYNNGTGQKSFEKHFEMEHCQLMSFIMRGRYTACTKTTYNAIAFINQTISQSGILFFVLFHHVTDYS